MTPNLFTPVRYTVTTFEAELRAERRRAILARVAIMALIIGNVILGFSVITARHQLRAQESHGR